MYDADFLNGPAQILDIALYVRQCFHDLLCFVQQEPLFRIVVVNLHAAQIVVLTVLGQLY